MLRRDDDYATAGKPVCDWDDPAAREALVDALARDAYALLAVLDGRELGAEVDTGGAAAGHGGRPGPRAGPTTGCSGSPAGSRQDRVISTVDPEARHGHKTAARGFDGYKGHVAIDPDSEIITATEVTAGNVGDAEPAADLLADDLPDSSRPATPATEPEPGRRCGGRGRRPRRDPGVYGDTAYGTGELLARLETAGSRIHEDPAADRAGWPVHQGPLRVDLDAGTVTCPAG